MAGKINVHAGDFTEGKGHSYDDWGKHFLLLTEEHSWQGEKIPLDAVESIETATEENVKKVGGTVGWGLLGLAALGPLGMAAGLLTGGRKKEVTFITKFKDGRKMMATTDSKTYTKLQAYFF